MNNLPDIDSPCGKNFTYRDFIECGETWLINKVNNIPIQIETYNALNEIAENILDPVIAKFGEIILTYGFASSNLTKLISGRIYPKLDQHASYELNRVNKPICARLGAACDFYIENNNMLSVAQWLVENTLFDRLYFYGNNKPIHVSIGPEQKRQIVTMKKGGRRLIPSVIKIENFLQVPY